MEIINNLEKVLNQNSVTPIRDTCLNTTISLSSSTSPEAIEDTSKSSNVLNNSAKISSIFPTLTGISNQTQ